MNCISYDLPPSQIAKPLPVSRPAKEENQSKQKTPNIQPKGSSEPKVSKRKREAPSHKDDTPRGFKRLMAFSKGKKRRSGLDDGDGTSTKGTQTRIPTESSALPKISPGESLWDYSARVDAALPVSGLVAKVVKNGQDPLGFKAHQTRKEKKMHKLYEQWRAEDRKAKEKREEALELEAERALEDGTLIPSSSLAFADGDEGGGRRQKNRKRKGKSHGPKADDPWEELRRKRGEERPKLSDVASAPPTLAKFKPKLPFHKQ
jgi:hypothetical protein